MPTDTNIDNYTIDELLLILNLTDPTPFNVKDVANSFIAKMKTDGRKDLENFFTQARDKVLEYLLSDDIKNREVDNEVTESTEKIWLDGGVKDKAKQPTIYFRDAERMVIENQTTSATTLAPPIISTHVIVIDSQYRTSILPYANNPTSNSFNTNFTFNLTSPINKALSLTLYSYQIPTSWYAFNVRSGNTFFMYNGIILQIPDGNYTPDQMANAINTVADSFLDTTGLNVIYNPNSQRFTFTNNNLLSGPITIIFYIQANVINYNNCGNYNLSEFQTLGINSTLGWLLGFRTTPDPVTGDVNLTINPGQTISADVTPQLFGPKYFYLSIEDYSNQRLSNGLYNITNTKSYNTLTVPDYYNTINVACKLREGSLTQAQLYSINAVIEGNANNNNVAGYKNTLSGPTSSSTFAIIPLEADIINNIRPYPYVKLGADLVTNKRNYVAPTILERFTVTLTDDKGHLVDLYDNDWSFSLLVEERLN
jgi:hypothetical protein